MAGAFVGTAIAEEIFNDDHDNDAGDNNDDSNNDNGNDGNDSGNDGSGDNSGGDQSDAQTVSDSGDYGSGGYDGGDYGNDGYGGGDGSGDAFGGFGGGDYGGGFGGGDVGGGDLGGGFDAEPTRKEGPARRGEVGGWGGRREAARPPASPWTPATLRRAAGPAGSRPALRRRQARRYGRSLLAGTAF